VSQVIPYLRSHASAILATAVLVSNSSILPKGIVAIAKAVVALCATN